MPTGRNFFKGSADSLAVVVLPHIDRPNWLPAKVDVKTAQANKNLITALYAAQSNLAFTQSTVEACLQQVASKAQWKAPIEEGKEKEWCKTMALRLRGLCSFVAQARFKKNKWAAELLPASEARLPPFHTLEILNAQSCGCWHKRLDEGRV